MKRIILWVLVLILVLITAGAFAVKQSRINEEEKRDEALSYFQERMTTLAIEDIGMPIEGFDAALLTMAYPGLVAADFQDVETLEGVYVVTNGEAVYKRGQGSGITSAERTVSEKGYGTLLDNLTTRLGVSGDTKEDIDNLIEKVNTADRIKTGVDEGGSAFGVTVTPVEIMEDSRCPVDVQCIQAGTVRVRALVEAASGASSKIFDLEKPVIIGDWEVTLTQTDPAPESGKEIKDGEYTFYFRISTIVN